jgi:hypothetical protein
MFGGFPVGPLIVEGDTVNPGLTVDGLNNVGIGVVSGTTATDGFPYIPSVSGTPTGTPRGITGLVPIVHDSGADKLWVYTAGAWHFVALT